MAALSFVGCGGATAQTTLAPLDPETTALVHGAYEAADYIHYDHYYYDEHTDIFAHCDANDLYEELQGKYYQAQLAGDTAGAARIGRALDELGDELDYDDFLWDYYHGGHIDCDCVPYDQYFGSHELYLMAQLGTAYQYTGVEEFTDHSKNWVYGGGIGLTFALPKPPANEYAAATYAFVRGNFYSFNGSTPLFGPASEASSRVNFLATGLLGAGGPLSRTYKLDWHVAAGGAIAEESVSLPLGSETKWTIGTAFNAGLEYKLDRRWSMTFDYDYIALRPRNFSPVPGANFDLSRTINMWLVGVRYTFGSTLP